MQKVLPPTKQKSLTGHLKERDIALQCGRGDLDEIESQIGEPGMKKLRRELRFKFIETL